MLWSTAYLESRLPSPLPTKDGGNLYAVKDVRAYVLGLAHSRSGHLYWQRAHQLLLDQADVVTCRTGSSCRILLSARCLGHSPKFKKLANNKPLECRSAVLLSPSFRPMPEG